jgi:hypothetical protein
MVKPSSPSGEIVGKVANCRREFAITPFLWGAGDVAKLMAGTDIISIWSSTYSKGVLQEVF